MGYFDGSSNFFTRRLPSEIALLQSMSYISLSYNQFTGNQTELLILINLQPFTYLLHLGAVPTEFGLLTNLQILHIRGNLLNGTISSEIGNMAALTSLRLESNAFSGLVPASFCDLGKLDELTLCKSTGGGCSNITGMPACLLNMGISNLVVGSIPIYNVTKSPTALPTLSFPTYLPSEAFNNTPFVGNTSSSRVESFLMSNMIYIITAAAVFLCCLVFQVLVYLHYRHSYFDVCFFMPHNVDDGASAGNDDVSSENGGIQALSAASVSFATSETVQQSA